MTAICEQPIIVTPCAPSRTSVNWTTLATALKEGDDEHIIAYTKEYRALFPAYSDGDPLYRLLLTTNSSSFLRWFLDYFNITRLHTFNLVRYLNECSDFIGAERLAIMQPYETMSNSRCPTSRHFAKRLALEQAIRGGALPDKKFEIKIEARANHLMMKEDCVRVLAHCQGPKMFELYYLAHRYNASNCLAYFYAHPDVLPVWNFIEITSNYISARLRPAGEHGNRRLTVAEAQGVITEVVTALSKLPFNKERLLTGLLNSNYRIDDKYIALQFMAQALTLFNGTLSVEDCWQLVAHRLEYHSHLDPEMLAYLHAVEAQTPIDTLPLSETKERNQRHNCPLVNCWIARYRYHLAIGSDAKVPFEYYAFQPLERDWLLIVGDTITAKAEYVAVLSIQHDYFVLVAPSETLTLPNTNGLLVVRLGMTQQEVVKEIYSL